MKNRKLNQNRKFEEIAESQYWKILANKKENIIKIILKDDSYETFINSILEDYDFYKNNNNEYFINLKKGDYKAFILGFMLAFLEFVDKEKNSKENIKEE